MPSFGDNMFKLSHYLSEQGKHPSDILVELRSGTLAAGTVELDTVFLDGDILAVLFMQNNATVNATVALSTDMVVTTGKITIAGPTGSTASFVAVILGRTRYS